MLNKVYSAKLLLVVISIVVFGAVWMPDSCYTGGAVQAAAPGAPDNLLVEYVMNPLGIDTLTPGFSWIVNDGDRGERQTAYQVIVASSLSNINGNIGDRWDSGKVISSQSTQVKYNGSSLAPDTRYWWKVKTWDKDDNVSAFSGVAFFDVGLTSGWTASYIWDGTTNANNFAYFRKKFTISKAVSLTKIYVTAHDDYKLFVNGTEIGRGPARCNPDKSELYNAYDITSNLVSGDNVIAAETHWHGLFGGGGKNALPAFILEARVKFTDATTLTVKTDGTWKTKAATPRQETSYVFLGQSFNNSRCVEKYDARLEIPGWEGVSFDDSGWANAGVVTRSYILKPQMLAQGKVQGIMDPVSVTQSGSDWYVDFGKCYNGWPRLTMDNATGGTQVTVSYSENTTEYQDYDIYTCKAVASQTWEPDSGYVSFRKLKITGYPGTLTSAKIKAIQFNTDLNKAGNFTCSSSLFNDIYELCERSQRENIQGISATDAWREQSQYTADAYLLGNVSLYNHKNALVLRKTVQDYANDQLASGNLPSICPSTTVQEIPQWTMHWFFCLWDQYLYFQDRDILSDNYTVMKNVLNFFAGYRDGTTKLLKNLPGWNIGDWPTDNIDKSSGIVTGDNCQYYRALRIAADTAAILGYTSDAAGYNTTADEVKNAINTYLLYNNTQYRDCKDSTQFHALSSCWPLIFDIVPDTYRSNVVNYIKTRGFEPDSYGGFWFANTLYDADEGPHMFNLLNNANDLWGRMVNMDRGRVCWERLHASGTEPSSGDMSYNHAWTCYPAQFFLKELMGIYPTGAGYSTFEIRPRVGGDLTYAEGTVPTVKGTITARWDKLAGNTGLTLTATVPANTTAKIQIPKQTYTNIIIKEGGVTIWNNGSYTGGVAGISYDGEETGYVRFNVGSGSYSFGLTGTYTGPTPTPTPNPNDRIVDNDDSGCAFTGSTWLRNTTDQVSERYGASFHHASAGNGSDYANFTPNLGVAGSYRVYAWWTSYSNRATNAPYTIYYNGGNQTVTVNQETGGGQWNLLGTYSFLAGTVGYVKLSNNANEYVIADAVEFEYVTGATSTPTSTPTPTPTPSPTPTSTGAFTASPTPTPIPTPIPVAYIIDNDDAGCALTGAWTRNATDEVTQRYGVSFHHAPAGDGSTYAKFTPNLAASGAYKVYAWWTTHTNRATNAPYTIYYNGGSQTVTVNQETGGGQWNLLGTYNFAAGTAGYVKLSNNASEYVVADAVKFEPDSGATATPTATATATLTPTPTPGANLALNKSVTASSSFEDAVLGWGKAKAVDGLRSSGAGSYGWSSTNNTGANHTEWITVDLGTSYSISKVDLYPRNDGVNTGYGFPVDFTIQLSTDNTNWTAVVTRTGYGLPGGVVQSFTFTSQTAQYVKINGTSLRSNPNDGNLYRMQFAEEEVY
jgi:alpha-L-rhamnosidase